jgi:hypothetical protein
MQAIQTIDLHTLAFVSGGQGAAERIGGTVGEGLGQLGARMVPPAWRPAAQVVLPPVGRAGGEWVGRQIDNWTRR